MSIIGRNLVKGATVQVYRQHKLEGSGGQTSRVPVKLLTDLLIELVPVTDEIALRVFGEGERVEVSAMAEAFQGIERGDLFWVTAGAYADRLFKVTHARPLGRYVELGLVATVETLGLPVGEAP